MTSISVVVGGLRISWPDNTNYRRVLDGLRDILFHRTMSIDDLESNTLDEMQKLYPGGYTVKALYDVDTHTVKFKLVFNSPRDETFFKLKYE
jgi:hypothetical protein